LKVKVVCPKCEALCILEEKNEEGWYIGSCRNCGEKLPKIKIGAEATEKLFEDYFKHKAAYTLLQSLADTEKTWKDLEVSINVSPRTLSRRIKEALALNLIERSLRIKDGRSTYKLTELGKKALKWANY